jgi:hypothetical protein
VPLAVVSKSMPFAGWSRNGTRTRLTKREARPLQAASGRCRLSAAADCGKAEQAGAEQGERRWFGHRNLGRIRESPEDHREVPGQPVGG